jgi:hypothetical protein
MCPSSSPFDDPPPVFSPPVVTSSKPRSGLPHDLSGPGDPHPPLPGGGMLIPVVLFLLSIYFWESAVLWPIKILTVFFHELSHGLAAVVTGGSIVKIELSANQGGVCWTSGGNRFVILSAGYLGSLLWGSGLFLAAAKTRYDRHIVGGLGVLLLIVTFAYVRTAMGFGFCLVCGLALIKFSKLFGEAGCDQLLRYLGLTSSFYVILDIKSDLIDRNVQGSDAYRLGEMLMIPGWVIGIIWMVIAIAVFYQVVKAGLSDPANDARIS